MVAATVTGAEPLQLEAKNANMTICFSDRLAEAIRAKRTAAVVGIDPVLERLPSELKPNDDTLKSAANALETFSRTVIDTVAAHIPIVKINSAFFEAFHEAGVGAYYRTVAHAHQHGLLVIGDVKRGDIGSTAKLYARGHLGQATFTDIDPDRIPDAVTLAGYLGENAIRPFIEVAREHGRGMYILVRPSDPGADLVHEFGGDRKFYEHMAGLVRSWGDDPGLIGESGLSCVGAVVAAKDAASTQALRDSMPSTPFLVPGFGAQGGTADTVRPCFRADGSGAIVNASRSVIYAFRNTDQATAGAGDWSRDVERAAQQFARDVGVLAGF